MTTSFDDTSLRRVGRGAHRRPRRARPAAWTIAGLVAAIPAVVAVDTGDDDRLLCLALLIALLAAGYAAPGYPRIDRHRAAHALVTVVACGSMQLGLFAAYGVVISDTVGDAGLALPWWIWTGLAWLSVAVVGLLGHVVTRVVVTALAVLSLACVPAGDLWFGVFLVAALVTFQDIGARGGFVASRGGMLPRFVGAVHVGTRAPVGGSLLLSGVTAAVLVTIGALAGDPVGLLVTGVVLAATGVVVLAAAGTVAAIAVSARSAVTRLAARYPVASPATEGVA